MTQPILLAEDDESDVIFMQYALEGARVSHPLQVVKDGQQAIDYLAGSGENMPTGSNTRCRCSCCWI